MRFPFVIWAVLSVAAVSAEAAAPIRTSFWARCYAKFFPAKKLDVFGPGPIDAAALGKFLRRKDGRPLFQLRGTERYTNQGISLAEQLEFANLRTRKNFAPVTEAGDDFRPDHPDVFADFVELVTYRKPVRDVAAFQTEVEVAMAKATGMRPSWGIVHDVPDVGRTTVPGAKEINEFLVEQGTTPAQTKTGFIAEPAYFNLIRNGILPVGNEHDLWAHAMLFGYREIREPTMRMANLFQTLFERVVAYDRAGAGAVFTDTADLMLAMNSSKLQKAAMLKLELTGFWGDVNEALMTYGPGGFRFMGGSGVFNAPAFANLGTPEYLRQFFGLLEVHIPSDLLGRARFGLLQNHARRWISEQYGMDLEGFVDALKTALQRAEKRLLADPNLAKLSPEARERLIAETIQAEERAALGGKTFLLDRGQVLSLWGARLDDVEHDIRRLFPATR